MIPKVIKKLIKKMLPIELGPLLSQPDSNVLIEGKVRALCS